jgi:hypothetical protein
MLNDKTIQTIAEAILANTKALQSLIDSLPREAQAAVAAKTVQSNDVAPVAQAPAPVVTQSAPAPAVAPVTVPTPAPAAPAMPAAPVFAPAPAAPAPTAPAVEVPFSDNNGMTQYVLNVYREIGPQRAAGIQAVIQQLGVTNINDIKPEQYGQLWAGVEAVRKAG